MLGCEGGAPPGLRLLQRVFSSAAVATEGLQHRTGSNRSFFVRHNTIFDKNYVLLFKSQFF